MGPWVLIAVIWIISRFFCLQLLKNINYSVVTTLYSIFLFSISKISKLNLISSQWDCNYHCVISSISFLNEAFPGSFRLQNFLKTFKVLQKHNFAGCSSFPLHHFSCNLHEFLLLLAKHTYGSYSHTGLFQTKKGASLLDNGP